MKTIFLTISCLVIVSALLTGCDDKSNTPESVAQIFCETTQDGNNEPPDDILSASLIEEIRIANQKNQHAIEMEPGDKPPLGDGIPYQGYQDHAPGCAVGTVSGSADDLKVEIRHSFPGDPKSNWSDFLLLKKVNKTWKIDDILYGSAQSQHGLKSQLKVMFGPQQ